MNSDLKRGAHVLRNAQEEYDFLITSGVSRQLALVQLGYTETSWKKAHEAAAQRQRRDDRKVLHDLVIGVDR